MTATTTRKPPGITNKQAHYLAMLQRQLGVAYTGNGLSRLEASAAIEACKARVQELRAAAVVHAQV